MNRIIRREGDQVPIDGEIRGETDKAIRFYDGSKEVWLPKSQIEIAEDGKSVLCPEWLAKDKGLI